MNAETFTAMLQTALRYAGMGWRIVPMRWPVDGRCSCTRGADCPRPAKHPLTEHGVHDATSDPDIIRGWWKRWPRANVGIACGAASGILVLDFDPRNGSDDFEFEPDPSAPVVITGGNGKHIYYAYQPGLGKDLAPGVELLGDGRIATAPYSEHVSGGRYRWERPPW